VSETGLPPKPSISEAEFEARAKHAGLRLTATQRQEMYRAFGYVEAMAARVRTRRELTAEPSNIFRPVDDFGAR
jgi:hypothetical protein